jgi:hypothetical protein
MAGLYRSAGAFFTYYLFVYVTFLAMTSFFRLLGTTMRSYDVAARLAAVIISFMVLFTGQCFALCLQHWLTHVIGYMIPVFSMPRWLFWVCFDWIRSLPLLTGICRSTTSIRSTTVTRESSLMSSSASGFCATHRTSSHMEASMTVPTSQTKSALSRVHAPGNHMSMVPTICLQRSKSTQETSGATSAFSSRSSSSSRPSK